jgi:predicted transcriptional regulator
LSEESKSNFLEHAAEIVAAYVSNNEVAPDQVAALIGSVHQALARLGQPEAASDEKPARLTSAQIKKTITPDYLVSLEDGRRHQTLKRHLARLGLTPGAYREKWGLPSDYPMVAPGYSARRSELARSLGLGQKRKKASPPPPPPAKRARGKRAQPEKAAAE